MAVDAQNEAYIGLCRVRETISVDRVREGKTGRGSGDSVAWINLWRGREEVFRGGRASRDRDGHCRTSSLTTKEVEWIRGGEGDSAGQKNGLLHHRH